MRFFYLIKRKFKFLYFRFLSTQCGGQPKSCQLFILGHQKSGTTAVAALIANLANLSLTNDIHRGNRDHEGYRKAHFHTKGQEELFLKYAYELSKDIVKEPELSFFYSSLKKWNSNSKFIYISREPSKIIKSILSRLGAREGSKEIYDSMFFDKLDEAPLWKDITGFSSGINIIEHLAKRIERLDSMYLENQGDFILLKYEDFMQNKVSTLKNVLLNAELVQINEANDLLDNQFQPKGSSVADDDYFTANELKLINDICTSSKKIYSVKLC